MTPDERRALAEQLTTNPLWGEVMDQIEATGIERMVAASTDTARMEAQAYVRATRAFRADCEAALRSPPPRKGAPC